jgi:uncharacterized membrane protein YfcA
MSGSEIVYVCLGVLLGLAAIAGVTLAAIAVPELAPTVAVAAFGLCCLFLVFKIAHQAQADLRAAHRHNMALSDRPPAQVQAQLEVRAAGNSASSPAEVPAARTRHMVGSR